MARPRGAGWSSPANDARGPAVNISGVANFGSSTSSPEQRDLDTYELADSVTLQRGAHLLTGRRQPACTSGCRSRSRAHTPGVYTFQSLAAFTAGRYVNFQQAFGRETQFQTSTSVAAFLQDEWRPRPALTVNAGLRYDLQRLADPIAADGNNLAPRIGVALAPGDGERSSVRAAACTTTVSRCGRCPTRCSATAPTIAWRC